MERLIRKPAILYDANLIVYYCFFVKIGTNRVRIIELTNKTRDLTHKLIPNTKIVTIKMVIGELKLKTITTIVSEYLKTPHRLTGLPRKGRHALRWKLIDAIEKNLDELIEKQWFEVKDYSPDDRQVTNLKQFFLNLTTDQRMIKLMAKKGRSSPIPSSVDNALICCSDNDQCILVSNDFDITCFSEELKNDSLCHEIIALSSLPRIQ